MLPLLIKFPVFDPIAISIGPIAVRWYALAYIGGIVLGWLYARSLLKNERLWGGPAPISLAQLDCASGQDSQVIWRASACTSELRSARSPNAMGSSMSSRRAIAMQKGTLYWIAMTSRASCDE